MSLLFSASHFSNLFFEDFSAIKMTEVLLSTFGFAMLYGAVFLRMQNLWPLIVLHTLEDFSFVISGTAGPFTTTPFPMSISITIVMLSLLYTVFIMRKFGEKYITQNNISV